MADFKALRGASGVTDSVGDQGLKKVCSGERIYHDQTDDLCRTFVKKSTLRSRSTLLDFKSGKSDNMTQFHLGVQDPTPSPSPKGTFLEI